MKREQYYFDKLYFNENKSLYTNLLQPLNELSEYYTGLGLKQPFTKEIMLRAINNLSEFQNSIVSDLAATMQLVNVPKVLHDSLQKQIELSINEIGEIVQRIKTSYNIARQFTRSSLIMDYDLFTVQESGKVIFDEANEQKLKDQCCIYLTNEKQKTAVSLVAQINDLTSELKSILANQTVLPDSNKEFLQNYTESFDGVKFSLNPWVVERLQ